MTDDDFIVEDSRESTLTADELIDALQEHGIGKVYMEGDDVYIDTTEEFTNRTVREQFLLGALLFEALERKDIFEHRAQPAMAFFNYLHIDENNYDRFLNICKEDKLSRVERDGRSSVYEIPFRHYHEVLDEFNIDY